MGGADIVVQCLLRYRLKEGKLALFYTMVRPEAMVREAFATTRDGIAKNLDVTILNGNIPA